MVEFRGAHGTSNSCAQEIKATGFHLRPGIRGTGAYFWRENAYSQELAIGWFLGERNRGKYKQDRDRRCAIIHAVITLTDEDFYYDLNNPDIEDLILERFKAAGFHADDYISAAKFFDDVVDLAEQGSGIHFKFTLTRVNSPQMAKGYPFREIGRPVCYVVRDNTCISIAKIDVFENREIGL